MMDTKTPHKPIGMATFGAPATNRPDPVAKRHNTKETAIIEVYGHTEKIFCRMNNLSTTGAFFEIITANYTPKKNQVVRISVNLKQLNKTYTLHGEIVWSKGLGLGISFIKQKDLFKKIAK
jgi:hypothetical protein